MASSMPFPRLAIRTEVSAVATVALAMTDGVCSRIRLETLGHQGQLQKLAVIPGLCLSCVTSNVRQRPCAKTAHPLANAQARFL
jgi:hypothetical protein